MADVEDPPRVVALLARHRVFDDGPGNDLRVNGRLEQAVVQEAGAAISLPVHRHEPNHARGGIQRLREPARIAGDILRRWGAGHRPH